MRKQSKRLRELYYITHLDNVPSILERGILSHAAIEREAVAHRPVYDRVIVYNRRERLAPDGRSLWEFANLYFQPRNPMLYRVLLESSRDEIVVLGVRRSVLDMPGIFVTTGNAASYYSEILPREEGLKRWPEIQQYISTTWWSEADGTKRKIMAEVLVPDRVPPHLIQTIYVADLRAKAEVQRRIGRRRIEIVPEPNMFFAPAYEYPLTATLRLVKGDMFFSGMQTLTISVNTVGVMGKGLASRAKYQFPDAYVEYQRVCREGLLKMGRPYLYKREASLEFQLADQPMSLTQLNKETWFLFFPTKRHWRERSSLEGIEQGLRWVQANYEREGIKSLAMPALGCGLGRLRWEDVGPLMCRYLAPLSIPVRVHLPLEYDLPREMLTPRFLLGG